MSFTPPLKSVIAEGRHVLMSGYQILSCDLGLLKGCACSAAGLLGDVDAAGFANSVRPGVYDIHSPRAARAECEEDDLCRCMRH
jgi:hypothetical protein